LRQRVEQIAPSNNLLDAFDLISKIEVSFRFTLNHEGEGTASSNGLISKPGFSQELFD
jgi:hypothetical protein